MAGAQDAELGHLVCPAVTAAEPAPGAKAAPNVGAAGAHPLLEQLEGEARAVRGGLGAAVRPAAAATGATAMLLLASAACVALPRPPQRSQLGTDLLQRLEEKCDMEDGVDFETKKALFAMQGIVSAKVCRQKCQEYSSCGAWTWGKTRDDYGLTNMCFLKALGMDQKPVRHKNDKVISGLSCRKKHEEEKPKRRPGVSPPSHTLTSIFDVESLMPQHDRLGPTSGELFCFALMLPGSYEQGLLAYQFKEKVNIFACDEYAVYSSDVIEVANGLKTGVVDSDLHCDKGGEFGTALNTEIFMAVWKKVITDKVFNRYDWTVKADPDTVFIAARLRRVVKDIEDSDVGVYLNNCKMGMHGPLEVFSRQAVWSWGRGAKKCFVHFYNLCSGPCLWGEDMFIDQCLTRVLHLKRLSIYNLLTEDHCDPPSGWKDCKNDSSVAFHPFKKIVDYKVCFANANRSQEGKEEKGKEQSEKKEKAKHEAKKTKEEKNDGNNEDDAEAEGEEDTEWGGKEDVEVEKDDCEAEDGVDFETKKALFAMEGIVSMSLCRQKCQEYSRCGAWTWGKTRDVWGLTNMCFLKVLEDGAMPVRHKNPKVVSGLPCRKPEKKPAGDMGEKPSEAMTSTFDLSHRSHEDVGATHKSLGALFCWVLMLPKSYEQALLEWQYEAGANLFGCDAYAVYSNISLEIADGVKTSVVDSSLQCQRGGEFGTALNTDIFMRVWKKVISDGIFSDYDWTVKVDPDTVFFAHRLKGILEVYRETDAGVYLNNCKMGLHGPLEVFSRNAVMAWSDGSQECFHHFYKLCSGPCLWGEDMFIDQCLEKVLHVRKVYVDNLLLEDHCDPPDGWDSCKDKSSVAFHPYKELSEYRTCMNNSLAK
uniref:Apple domain-containing protein n=2 Tax=Pyrodinium bahamense TaxID=73915 RepID=A0A7S0FY91_9DINO